MATSVCSRGSPSKGTKSKVATSALPSQGATSGWKCYVTPVFSGVPMKGDKIKSGYITPAFSGAVSGQKCYITPVFSGFPKKGDRIGPRRASGRMP